MMRKSPVAPLLFFGSVIIFAFIAYVYFSGKLADFFLGEEYYVLSNAAVYPHYEAWWRYFLANGRLVEGIYWTYLYELLDFSPAEFRVFSYILVFVGALLAAIAVTRCWPGKERKPIVSFLLLLLFFFAPYALNWANRLSGDNSRLSIIFFWIGVIFLQQWVANDFKRRYLIGSIGFQLLSVLTYENAAFLFPAGIFLILPLLPKEKRTRKDYSRLAWLGLASLFFVFIPYAAYSILAMVPGVYLSHYAVSAGSGLGERIVSFFPNLWHYLANVANTDVELRGLWGPLFYLLVLVLCGVLLYARFYRQVSHNQDQAKKTNEEKLAYSSLFVAAIWLFIFGVSIYALLGIVSDTPTRVYVAAMMGFPILLVLLASLVPGKVWRSAACLAMLLWVQMSYVEFRGRTSRLAIREEQFNSYLLSIFELAPAVKPNTWFVLVDFEIGGSGCGPSLSMLYVQPDLLCARLSTIDRAYIADRHEDDLLNVRNTGGWIRNGNILIFGIDSQGEMYIIPQITPEDNVYINWISTDPIRTDFRRITTDSSGEISPMAKHLYERRQFLLAN